MRLSVIFVATRAVRPILCTVNCVSVFDASCMSACLATCVPVVLLPRPLIGHFASTGGRDQQWAAREWTDRQCVSSIFSFYARRGAVERIYFIFHDAEKYLKRCGLL